MMNESHALTERSRGVAKWSKRQILKFFHSALVGGTAQAEHFKNLGIPCNRIFDGYDAVDNEYFRKGAIVARVNQEATRKRLGLPRKYILNLGRMVPKKNLKCLIEAYSIVSRDTSFMHSLVLVGGGELESSLRDQALHSNLLVRDTSSEVLPGVSPRTVFFAGYGMPEDNPAYYALADLFVLPSIVEEWGLVVNEAMACELPVVVSKNAGASFDLVKDGMNGYVYDPMSASQLAAKVVSVLSCDARRCKMASESSRIISHWGCERFADHAMQAIDAAGNLTRAVNLTTP
jgi:glycosyltransferase involved in cell wall biosynthesis